VNPIFIEYYSHLNTDCYKILNPWTNWKEEKIVICPVSDGYEKAKELAQKLIMNQFDMATEKGI